jgi:hypothetical protein
MASTKPSTLYNATHISDSIIAENIEGSSNPLTLSEILGNPIKTTRKLMKFAIKKGKNAQNITLDL